MKLPNRIAKKVATLSLLVAAGLLSPVSVSPGQGFAIVDACAQGDDDDWGGVSCCAEFMSFCAADLTMPGYYASERGCVRWHTSTPADVAR